MTCRGEPGGECRDEAVGPEEFVRIIGGCEQLVEDLRSDVHWSQGVAESPSGTAAYTRLLTLQNNQAKTSRREVNM